MAEQKMDHSNDRRLGDLTIRDVLSGDEDFVSCVNVFMDAIKGFRGVENGDRSTEHLLNCIWVNADRTAFCYDPGDEEPMRVEELFGGQVS